MRLFIAINLNDKVKEKLYNIALKLKSQVIKGNFTRKENLHLTLVFIGETNDVTAVKNVMETINLPPFEIKLNGLGKFKRAGGDIYWIGTQENKILTDLHQQLSSALLNMGFKIEKRPFKPHLTLGREVVIKERLNMEVPKFNININKISLMKSERIDGKLTYTEIYKKDLQ